jgi:uncharacterized membrane protein
LYLLLAAGLAVFLILASRLAQAPGARAKLLVVLRALALGVLILILLNPVQVEETLHRGPEPAAVFLLDESRSMSLERPVSRAQAVDTLIHSAQTLVPSDRRPGIQKFGFGRDLVAITDQPQDRRPDADVTRLAWALEELPTRFGTSLPFGVFVFSDGRSTEPESLEPTAQAFRSLGVPVHVVPVGDARVSGDVAVQDIDAPREAPPGTRVPVRVTLRSRGYDGQRTELRIRSAANSRESLVTLPVTLSGGEQAHDLVIETDKAKGPLTVDVQLLPHEAIASNNTVPFQITPREAKLRVIYMEGSNPPEYTFLENALQEDPDINCLSLYVDNQYNSSPSLHRINDPGRGFPSTREELLSYDVVICSDIARLAFTPQQLEWTVELVSKRGGGFAMVGGHTSFGAGEWDQTIWDGLIPVDMSGHGAGVRSQYFDGPFRVVIPPKAELHPIWKIVDDPARNRQILDKMPQFNGTNLTDRLKPAATALGLSDRPLPGSAIVTVFACQSFGRGRTFAMATDTTYAWGTEFETTWGEGDNRYFRKFWRNVVRWLSENSTGANRRLQVATDKVIYRPGQDIQVTAHAFDEKLSETDRYRVVAALRSGGQTESQPSTSSQTNLVPQLDDAAYRGTLLTPPASTVLENPGSTMQQLSLDVSALDGETVVAKSSIPLQVIDDPAEFRDPRPDSGKLEQLARAAGGRVIHSPAELAALLGDHPQASERKVVTRSPLWDRPALWLLFLGLLSSEWILRRRKGLA